MPPPAKPEVPSKWTLMSNHGHVLVCIGGDPDVRLRDISARVGITERAVFGIVEDLEAAGVLQRIKIGRRNRYLINVEQPMRHPLEAHQTVGALLSLFAWSDGEMDELDRSGATASAH